MVYAQSRNPKFTHVKVLDYALYGPWISTLMSGHLRTWVRSTNSLIVHSHAEPVNRVLQRGGQKYQSIKWNMRVKQIALVLKIGTLNY